MSHVLNVAPILFDDATITIEKLPYSDEQYQILLNELRGTHVVFRRGNSIIAVARDGKAGITGATTEEVKLKEDLSLVRSLVREALYRQLVTREVMISNLNPITYLANKVNLLEEFLPAGSANSKGVGVFVKYELELVIINPNGTGPFIGLSINITTAPRILMNCHSLHSSGVPLTGFYVGERHSSKNPELRPHFQTIGRVQSILDNGMLQLDDVRQGHEAEVDPVDVYLEPREDNLHHCVSHLFKSQATTIMANLEKKLTAFHIGNTKFDKLIKALQIFQEMPLQLTEGCPFSVGNFLSDLTTSTPVITVSSSEKPLFVFSQSGVQNNVMNDFGLQRYGPYSKETFTPAKPRICVVCQKSKKGQVEQVLHKFLNGMPPVEYTKGKQFTYTGLKTKYYLQDFTVEFFCSDNDHIDGYNKAIAEALQDSAAGKPWNLALVQIDKNFESRPDNQNPYLAAKARFIGQNVPVQEFTLESLGLPDNKVVWSINNMALAAYAKLGGTPWILSADKPIAHEVVFGIGSAMAQSSRLGTKERLIGITSVFMGDGNYFINNISSAVPEDAYFDTLLKNLRETMKRIKETYNWQPRDNVRLIFHAFKTFKDVEAQAVKALMSELGDYHVEYAFVHVAANHPYMLFDTESAGIGFYNKGVYAPLRTKFMQLSEHVSLVVLTGPMELKKTEDGTPRPIQLILHRDSTFKDLRYLSIQVIKFGAHSWRSFLPAPMPVSVYYSQLVAQMLSQLANVPFWNSDFLYGKISSTRWFL